MTTPAAVPFPTGPATYPLANMSNANTWSFSRSVRGWDLDSVVIVFSALPRSLLSRTELPVPISSNPLAMTCPITMEMSGTEIQMIHLYTSMKSFGLVWLKMGFICSQRTLKRPINFKFSLPFMTGIGKDSRWKKRKHHYSLLSPVKKVYRILYNTPVSTCQNEVHKETG